VSYLNIQSNPVERCSICHFQPSFCICAEIPRIDLTTKICLVIHTSELTRRANTGLLALNALVNSEMRVRGETKEPLDLSDLLIPRYRTWLFYPSRDAVELTQELVAQEQTPVQLIVPDGNWRQAGKVHYRHTELKNVTRVIISAPNSSKFRLRQQHRREGMATLQAIAHALGIIEGDGVKAELMKLYQLKLKQTLVVRGLSGRAENWHWI
jgi:DTW domain-containing protein YfiP